MADVAERAERVVAGEGLDVVGGEVVKQQRGRSDRTRHSRACARNALNVRPLPRFECLRDKLTLSIPPPPRRRVVTVRTRVCSTLTGARRALAYARSQGYPGTYPRKLG